jgi:hypothetical protein
VTVAIVFLLGVFFGALLNALWDEVVELFFYREDKP